MPSSDQKRMRVEYITEVAKQRGFKLPTNFVIGTQGSRSWEKIKGLYRLLELDWHNDVPAGYWGPVMPAEKTKEQRIHEIREQIRNLADELLGLVNPSDEERAELVQDAETEPGIYMSYLVEDSLFIAENVLDNRECDAESEAPDVDTK